MCRAEAKCLSADDGCLLSNNNHLQKLVLIMSIGQQNKYRKHSFSGSLFMAAHVRRKTFSFSMNRSPVREPDAVRGRRQGCTYRGGTESTGAAAVSRSPAPPPCLVTFPPSFQHVSVPKLKKLRFNN